jgi:nucleoside-diphosphate-sugar epimerase
LEKLECEGEIQMANLLITGAGGYIGSVLVRMALDAGHQVTALDRYFFGEKVFADITGHENLKILKQDIRDVEPRDFEGVDGVIDLAALSNDPSGDLDPSLTEAINYQGRVRVARCAKQAGVSRYLLSSSCSVYGAAEGENLTEESRPHPLTIYAKSVLKAEAETRELATRDFCWTALRNATVFGLSHRMRFDLVINLMTLNAVQTGKIFVMGGGKQWRPLVHVNDVAAAFLHIFEQPQDKVNGEIFNIGYDNHQIISLAYIVRETLPFPIQIELAPDDPDKRNYKVSFSKAARSLDLQSRHSVNDGVVEIYEAMKFGKISATAETSTVGWYKTILEADQLVCRIRLNGRLL